MHQQGFEKAGNSSKLGLGEYFHSTVKKWLEDCSFSQFFFLPSVFHGRLGEQDRLSTWLWAVQQQRPIARKKLSVQNPRFLFCHCARHHSALCLYSRLAGIPCGSDSSIVQRNLGCGRWGGLNLFCGGGTNTEYCRAWGGQFSQVLRGELVEINAALYRNTSLWLSPPPKNQTL